MARFDHRGDLGRGGTGVVRRTFDAELQREVADKRLEFPLTDKKDLVERFVQEARTLGQLEHPNIVPVHDFGQAPDGSWFLHMKLVEGKTLQQLVQGDGAARLRPERLAEYIGIIVRVCDALAFAHSKGVVHRDLKPSNVMVGEYGQVYLVDWGVARYLRVGEGGIQGVQSLDDPEAVYGTPAYMAPEQVAAPLEVDERTDIWSLGATLWAVLVGRRPYEGARMQVFMKVMQCRVPPAHEAVIDGEVPVALSRIVSKAMAHNPKNRFQTVLEMKRALEDFLRGQWHLESARFAAGERVIREGDPGDVAYVIAEGRLQAWTLVDGERRVLREMGPGEVFGEMAIFTDRPRSSNVEAVTDVVLQVVTRRTLLEGTGLNTWIGKFITALADRFVETEGKLLARGLSEPGGAPR